MSLRKNLEDIVFENGLTDILRLERAKHEAETRDVPLATTLIDLGFVEQRALAELIARVTGFTLFDPLPDDAVVHLRDRLPPGLAREATAVPVQLSGTRLTVAMLDPTNSTQVEALERESGLTIVPAVAIRSALEMLISRIYTLPDQQSDVDGLTLESPGSASRRAAASMADLPEIDFGTVVATADESGEESTAPRGSREIRPLEIRVDRLEERVVDIVRILADVQARLDAIEARLRRLPNS